MTRLFVHERVDDVPASIAFYSALFGAPPSSHSEAGAEWVLDDPELDFAISRRTGGEPTLTRLGLQIRDDAKFDALRDRFDHIGQSFDSAAPAGPTVAGGQQQWLMDPSGVLWEAFTGSDPRFGAGPSRAEVVEARRRRSDADLYVGIVRPRRWQRRREPYRPRPYGRI